jgi:hypothetical protein
VGFCIMNIVGLHEFSPMDLVYHGIWAVLIWRVYG